MSISLDEVSFIKTSSSNLNRLLGGGFLRGQIYAEVASGGVGKTQIVLDASFNLISKGGSVLYIATEPLNLQRLNQLIENKLGKSFNIKIPDKDKKGNKLNRKQKYNYYRKVFFKQLKKMGFYYVDVRDFGELKQAIKRYVGDYSPHGDQYKLTLPTVGKKILRKIDLLVIDSITFTLQTQMQGIHNFGNAMKWEIRTMALIETVSQMFNFSVVLPVQRISELSKAIKKTDRRNSPQVKDTLKALEKTVNDRDYVGGKAIMHGSRVILSLYGDENPRKVALIKSTHKETGSDSEIESFNITDTGISDP